MANQATIGTHSGKQGILSFHCDEAMACFLLQQLPQFENSTIVRTRDPNILNTLTILVDVGGEYGNLQKDPDRLRYDHHQAGFTETFGGRHNKIKLSSAGLIYKHYGIEVVRKFMKNPQEDALRTVYLKIYGDYISTLDGIDNGIPQYANYTSENYRDYTNLASRVGYLNADWNEPQNDQDERFLRAVQLVGSEFIEWVRIVEQVWLPAKQIVSEGYSQRFQIHPSGKIIKLETQCPWKQHLNEIETQEKIIYVIYNTADSWRVQCVPGEKQFENRLSLPQQWRGLRDEQLQQMSGIPTAVFVHANGFIGGARTLEDAIQMASISLELPGNS